MKLKVIFNYMDLGADHLISAQKSNEVIAVEVKSFIGVSDKLERYRDIVEKFINDYAQYQYAYGEVERLVVCDRDQYLLMIKKIRK